MANNPETKKPQGPVKQEVGGGNGKLASSMPAGDDDFEGRKNRWKQVIDQIANEPGAANFLVTMGSQMMQPVGPQQDAMGQLGQGLQAASQRTNQLRQQQVQEQQQERLIDLQEESQDLRRDLAEEKRQWKTEAREDRQQFKLDLLDKKQKHDLEKLFTKAATEEGAGGIEQGDVNEAYANAVDSYKIQQEHDCKAYGVENERCQQWNDPGFRKRFIREQMREQLRFTDGVGEEEIPDVNKQQVEQWLQEGRPVQGQLLKDTGVMEDADPNQTYQLEPEAQGQGQQEQQQEQEQAPSSGEGQDQQQEPSGQRGRGARSSQEETQLPDRATLESMSDEELMQAAQNAGVDTTVGMRGQRRQKTREELIETIMQGEVTLQDLMPQGSQVQTRGQQQQ